MTGPIAEFDPAAVTGWRAIARRSRGAVAAALCLLVAACSAFEGPIQYACPVSVVLTDAQQVTFFVPGPGRDLTDVLYDGTISGVFSGCEYDDEGNVEIDLDIDFLLTRGPALEGDIARYEYFVIVTNPEDSIIAKKMIPLDIEFARTAFRAAITEAGVTPKIKYPPWPDASDFRIIVGFQLSLEQVEYMHERKQ